MDGQRNNLYKNSEEIICRAQNEIWKDIEGFAGFYQVSNMGRVRSLTRKVWNYTKKGMVLYPQSKSNGYLNVCLSNGKVKQKHAYIHRLVASAFIPNPRGLSEINHKNFDKTDNRAENLEWCTSKENKVHFRASQYARIADRKKEKTLHNKSLQYILQYKNTVCGLYDQGISIQNVAKSTGLGRDKVRDILVIYGRV